MVDQLLCRQITQSIQGQLHYPEQTVFVLFMYVRRHLKINVKVVCKLTDFSIKHPSSEFICIMAYGHFQQAELDGSVTWDAQKTNISGILSSWLDQQNFPLLEATDLADGSLKVTQSHFLYDKEQTALHPTPLG